MRNIDKDELISKFEKEVVALKRKNEMQAVYLVRGFEIVLRVKDEEKKRLALENAKLRRTVTVLEEQLADQAVYNVTQWFNGGNIGHEGIVGGMSACGDKACGGQQRSTLECLVIVLDASLVSFVLAAFHHIETGVSADVVQCAKPEVVVVSPLMAEGGWASGGPNSFVRKIKAKVRKNLSNI
ncbi:hypothetical protein LOK49_LG02G00753 [Camellia lanceoleosa]|uniref:Uncharacterized protein n=1 Tax=Camellia lanceoleosa TaxID=1840588 RepID=A0ACC0IR56_9ERIC|nr:hypothetical protein LOK49_LG02G00753 [Camellia lanceoleosa]